LLSLFIISRSNAVCHLRVVTSEENNTQVHHVLLTDDGTIMMSPSKKLSHMFRIKFPTKRIFRIFHILKISEIAPFCKLIYRTTPVFTQILVFGYSPNSYIDIKYHVSIR